LEAELPFDWILHEVTGSDPNVTDYVFRSTSEMLAVWGDDRGKDVGRTSNDVNGTLKLWYPT
jgi:hypothetical protein